MMSLEVWMWMCEQNRDLLLQEAKSAAPEARACQDTQEKTTGRANKCLYVSHLIDR